MDENSEYYLSLIHYPDKSYLYTPLVHLVLKWVYS